MTIREAILCFPGVSDGEDFLDKILIDRSINGADGYTASSIKTVNLAAADVYAVLGGLPDFSENKLSMTYPRDWYTQKAKELYTANGEPENAATLGKKIVIPRGKAPNLW